jgi:hypothetical protein
LHPQCSSPGNGLCTATLVEAVTVVFIDLFKYRQRAFTLRTPHQGFVGENRMIPKVYDRLVSESEIKAQGLALLAAHAPLVGRGE